MFKQNNSNNKYDTYKKQTSKNNQQKNYYKQQNFIPNKKSHEPFKTDREFNKFYNNKQINFYKKKNFVYKNKYFIPGERYNREDSRFRRQLSKIVQSNQKRIQSNQRKNLLSKTTNSKIVQSNQKRIQSNQRKNLLSKTTNSKIVQSNQKRIQSNQRKNLLSKTTNSKIVQPFKKKNPFDCIRNSKYNAAVQNMIDLPEAFEKEIEIQRQNFFSENKKIDLNSLACQVMLRRENPALRICFFPKGKFSKRGRMYQKQITNNSNYKFNKYSKKPVFNYKINKKILIKTNKYLYLNKKTRTGIFVKPPLLDEIKYPFILNLKLINEYFANH